MDRELSGTTVHFERYGSGSNRILLLHGWGCEIKLMKPVADFLSADAEVLVVDFPAHGQSGRPPEPWGVPEYAQCIRQLIEAESFSPCAVVAHSFGVRVAIWLSSEYPQLFTKLVFTGGAGIRKPQTEEQKKRSEQYKRLRSVADTMKKVGIFGSLPEKMEDKLRHKYGSADYNALDAEMRKTFVKVISLDLTDRLSSIKQPTLLLWGDLDDATPYWMGQKMEEMIPDAGLIKLTGGTHFAYLEQLNTFNTIVHHFLTEG